MATVVPRLKKRRISPGLAQGGVLPDAPYTFVPSPVPAYGRGTPTNMMLPNGALLDSSLATPLYPALDMRMAHEALAPPSSLPGSVPSSASVAPPQHTPASMACVREVIGGQERQVYVISDDDGTPPPSPLRNPPAVAAPSSHSSVGAGSKREAPDADLSAAARIHADALNGYAAGASDGPSLAKRRRHDPVANDTAPMASTPKLFGGTQPAGATSAPDAYMQQATAAASPYAALAYAPELAAPTNAQNTAATTTLAPESVPSPFVLQQMAAGVARTHTDAARPQQDVAPSAGTDANAGAANAYRVPNYYGARAPVAQPWADNTAGMSTSMLTKNVPLDDKDGHFIVRDGDYITPRYQICGLLGQGTFGKVVNCYDRKLRRRVAIKVIRAVQKYRDASQIEIRVLRCLRQHDPANEYQCVRLIETFDYRNHVCIVSDLLDRSVFDFLKDNQFQPFPCRDIWLFAKQLLKSVAFLHDLSLVHTDLKPENVLLVDASFDLVATSRRANARKKRVLRNAEIRLIDFGSATFNDEYHSGVVSTRHYRAPEIILGMGWSFPCDIWSVGCILVEFFTGDALFQTHDNLEHLAMMEMVLGHLPDDFRRKAETYKPEYFSSGQLDYPKSDTSKQSRRYVQSMKRLEQIASGPAAYTKHNQAFVALLHRLLEFDPARRITVHEALKHPYFDLLPGDIPT
ncbi:dual-specificity kinase [Malassezia sp. CBS 17886]|nr:dual-specificity kinase [Malassezia sp. CBS 17886]